MPAFEVYDVEQNTPEWFEARRGIPTSSEYSTVISTKGRGGGESITRRKYINRLAGEIITGEVQEGYTNRHMERGHVMQPEARDTYSFVTGNKVELVGFVRNGRTGCSPDGLVGEHGMLEIKTCLPHILIEHIRAGDFPDEHRAQCQGQLMVTGRHWCDLALYWPTMPLIIRRAFRDDLYIKGLREAIDKFNREVDQVVHLVRRELGEEDNKPLREDLKRSLELVR